MHIGFFWCTGRCCLFTMDPQSSHVTFSNDFSRCVLPLPVHCLLYASSDNLTTRLPPSIVMYSVFVAFILSPTDRAVLVCVCGVVACTSTGNIQLLSCWWCAKFHPLRAYKKRSMKNPFEHGISGAPKVWRGDEGIYKFRKNHTDQPNTNVGMNQIKGMNRINQ